MIQFLSDLWTFLIYSILKLANKLNYRKKSSYKDNVLTIKFHNSPIHSIFLS